MVESLNVLFRGRKVCVPISRVSFFGKFWGLMFSSRYKKNLLFDWGRDVFFGIHSFFVFYDFLAIWVDSDKKVLQVDRVRPFRAYVGCKKKYRYLIEIPVNRKNKSLLREFLRN